MECQLISLSRYLPAHGHAYERFDIRTGYRVVKVLQAELQTCSRQKCSERCRSLVQNHWEADSRVDGCNSWDISGDDLYSGMPQEGDNVLENPPYILMEVFLEVVSGQPDAQVAVLINVVV